MVSSGETKLLKTTIACDRWWTDWLLLLLIFNHAHAGGISRAITERFRGAPIFAKAFAFLST